MNITHPPQTDEQKDASIQLNNIGTINALNTHNWELQRKVMMLNAENVKLREALKNVLDDSYSKMPPVTNVRMVSVGTLVAVREALGETE